ncbi:MAG: pyruvate kinase [Patescibacteria group bacterium]|jgi:pyruvate kinase
MNKFTKIIATIGPATDDPEMIEKLIEAGVNIFRYNFKHNTVEWHNERIRRVNAVSKKMGVHVGKLIDLQGPEIRIKMAQDSITIKEGDELLFDESMLINKGQGFSISHPSIIEHMTDGQKLLADDGSFTFVVKREKGKCYLVSHSEGVLKNNKSLNMPGSKFPLPVLIERDFDGLKLAQMGEVDFVALSFVRTKEDVLTLRKEMKKLGLVAKVVSKIETQVALDNFDEILSASDAIMVARGDLGVEIPIEQVPYYQKMMIKRCFQKGVSVITATQMLQTMIDNPFPTRAEVSDVANATYDFTDAVMLSGETASGKYPLQAVKMMAKTVAFNEQKPYADTRSLYQFELGDQEQRLSDAAYNLYIQSLNVENTIAGFVILTETGRTAQLLSRYRAKAPIFAICPTKKVADTLSINFAVTPFVRDEVYSKDKEVTSDDVVKVISYLHKNKILKKGQKVVVLHGDYWAVEGGTSTVKIVEV